jgi:predicted N-acyltransferase
MGQQEEKLMSESVPGTSAEFRFVLADSIAFLNPDHWDCVTARSGLFLSRPFLRLLEQHLPGDLSTHYAIVYAGDRPVAAVVAQSLEIRVADLSPGRLPEITPGFWHSLGGASHRSIKRVLLYDNLLLWPFHGEAVPAAAPGELWPDVALGLWHRFRHLLKVAERAAELPVGWVRLRFLVCGNLLAPGPHGVAFAGDEDPARLWPAVVEALYRMRRSGTIFGESDMVMIKDLTDEQAEAGAALRKSAFRLFETEPNMVLQMKPSWANFDDCLNDMKSAYRSGIRKTLQSLGESGIVLERITPEQVEAAAPEIYALYHQVHDRKKLHLATIGEKWIPALARHYQDDFRTVVARPKEGGKILGFVTLIRDGDSVLGYYVGFNKAGADKGLPLYVSLVYAAVAQAIEMRASRLVLGRTALGPKAQIGAKPQAMYCHLRHRSSVLNLAVPSILAVLPAPKQPPDRHPFKK